MKISRKLSFFLIGLLSIWFVVSTIRTLFNLSKIFTEEIKWFQQTEKQKRMELYGDTYLFTEYINSSFSSDEELLIITNEAKHYFLSRYLLYPRKVYWDRLDNNLKKYNSYKMIAIYHPEDVNEKQVLDVIEKVKKKKVKSELKIENNVVSVFYK